MKSKGFKVRDTFCVRADVDSLTGLRKGIPKLLGLAERMQVKASVYSIVGWEGDFYSVLKHRLLGKKRFSMPHANGIFKPSSPEIARMLFFPTPFYKQKEFKEIAERGHELGVHGFVHARWNNLSGIDAEREFGQMIAGFEGVFGKRPESFSAPLEAESREIARLVEKSGFECRSYAGEKVFLQKLENKGKGVVMVPVTISESKTCQPIIEQLLSEGRTKRQAAEFLKKKIEEKIEKKQLASFYIHPEVEALHAFEVLEDVFRHVKELGLKTKTSLEIARKFKKKSN